MIGLRKLANLLIAAGIVLCAAYLGSRAYSAITSRLLLLGAQQTTEAATPSQPATAPAATPPPAMSFKDWSAKRIAAYRKSLTSFAGTAVAVLTIPRIGLEVPVLTGTADATLDRGAGTIEGTPEPGGEGNAGIAGHRDGFFRALKDIKTGDKVLVTKGGAVHPYVVERIIIVNPKDTWVLENRGVPSLTLVTCFPFYGVGPAPQRYIVQAVLDRSALN